MAEKSAVSADFLQGSDVDLEVLQPQESLEVVAYDYVAREFARHAGAAMPEEVDWPADDNGWLVRLDGKRYAPHAGQHDFHVDPAVVKAIIGGRGSGKALDLATPLPTPTGWTSMGDVAPGDLLFDERGEVCRVLSVSAIMERNECYEVVFDDGSTIVADAGHLWITLDAKARKSLRRRHKKWVNGNHQTLPQCQPKHEAKVRTTLAIKKTLTYTKRGDRNHCIPMAAPLNTHQAELPIPPYVLGVWLGDGTSAGSGLTIGKQDARELSRHIESEGLTVASLPHHQLAFRIGESSAIRDPVTGQYNRREGSFFAGLDELGLIQNKHIPPQYLRASYQQRLDLLQGLMDTDGSIQKNGSAEFASSNLALIHEVAELCRTLMIKTSVRARTARYDGQEFPAYRLHFTPNVPVFRLKRKAQRIQPAGNQAVRRYRRYIVDVRPVESRPVRCIEVDSPSHLFLAGEAMTPTHNSAGGIQEVQRKIKAGEPGLILGPTEKHFFRSTWVQLNEWLPIDPAVTGVPTTPLVEHWSKTDQIIRFKTGSIVQYGGIYDPDDWRGPNVNWVWLDEPGRIKKETAFLILLGTLRVGRDPMMVLTTTPRGVNHWLYKYFVQREIDDEVIVALEEAGLPSDPQLLFNWHRVTTEQNRENLHPIFYATLKMAYKGVWAEQELEGKFVSFEGLVYPDYDPQVHLIDRRKLPADWSRFWFVDFGYKNPFVAQLWARSPDDRWYREFEIYMSGRRVSEHAEKMKEIMKDHFDHELFVKRCICDTDAEDQAQLRAAGFRTTSAKKDVRAGIQAVSAELSLDDDEEPRLYLMRGALVEVDRSREAQDLPTCTEEEITRYVWPDTGESGELKHERPVKEHDHGMDAMRYGIYTLSQPQKESKIRWA